MSNYTKSITRTYEFDGDTVTVKLSRLKKKAVLQLAPFMPDPDEEGNVKVSMKFDESLEFVEAACGVLKKYVKSFEGLRDSEGSIISLEDVLNGFGDEDGIDVYFMSLVSDIFSDLFAISFPEKDEEDKVKKQSENTMGDLETMNALQSEG